MKSPVLPELVEGQGGFFVLPEDKYILGRPQLYIA